MKVKIGENVNIVMDNVYSIQKCKVKHNNKYFVLITFNNGKEIKSSQFTSPMGIDNFIKFLKYIKDNDEYKKSAYKDKIAINIDHFIKDYNYDPIKDMENKRIKSLLTNLEEFENAFNPILKEKSNNHIDYGNNDVNKNSSILGIIAGFIGIGVLSYMIYK